MMENIMSKGFTGLPIEIFRKRIEKIKQELLKINLDALFSFSDEYRPGYTLYLSDYYPINVIEESPQGVYVPRHGDVVLFLGSINAQTAKGISWIEDIRSIDKMSFFFNNLKEKTGRRLKIGLVGEALLPVCYYQKLRSCLANNDFIYVDDIINRMRQIKDLDEIKLMEKAAHLGDQAIREASKRLREGDVKEIELAAVAEYSIRSKGGNIGSATILSSGINTKKPTWRPSNKKIMPGEAVLIDVNPSLNCYCSDVSVTLFNGRVSKEKQKLLNLSKEILRGVIEHIKPGVPASTIYAYFLEKVQKMGYEKYFTPYAKGFRAVGHGVGLDVVEWPNLDSKSNFILKPGMTLAVKFDLHGFNFGGIRHEVDVLVEENQCRSLNNIIYEDL
jgi:Xaa-Pro dipeptidase